MGIWHQFTVWLNYLKHTHTHTHTQTHTYQLNYSYTLIKLLARTQNYHKNLFYLLGSEHYDVHITFNGALSLLALRFTASKTSKMFLTQHRRRHSFTCSPVHSSLHSCTRLHDFQLCTQHSIHPSSNCPHDTLDKLHFFVIAFTQAFPLLVLATVQITLVETILPFFSLYTATEDYITLS